jgi:hypothetical protein
LQAIYGWVFTVYVIADGRFRHGAAHLGAGMRDGVAAQIHGVLDGENVVGISELVAFGDCVGHKFLDAE